MSTPGADKLDELPYVVGRYAIWNEIASGGMATVHLGRLVGPVGFSRTVAIKRLHPARAKDPDFVTMFVDEARLAARIRHPNVVPTVDVVVEDDEIFLVMEYVHGVSLRGLETRLQQTKKLIPPDVAASIVVSSLLGLHAAHEATDERGQPMHLVHRDVSPQNILVGNDGVTRVVDFGVARAEGRMAETKDGTIKGKLAYVSPEQLDGHTATLRADIFGAGVVLWEALTGQRLFLGKSEGETLRMVMAAKVPPPSSKREGLPPKIDAVVVRATAKDPKDRYATALEMASAIEEALPIAPARRVRQWVIETIGDVLKQREKVLKEIEAKGADEATSSARLATPGSQPRAGSVPRMPAGSPANPPVSPPARPDLGSAPRLPVASVPDLAPPSIPSLSPPWTGVVERGESPSRKDDAPELPGFMATLAADPLAPSGHGPAAPMAGETARPPRRRVAASEPLELAAIKEDSTKRSAVSAPELPAPNVARTAPVLRGREGPRERSFRSSGIEMPSGKNVLFVAIPLLLILAVGATLVFLPRMIRARVLAAAKEAGVEIVAESIDASMGEVRMNGVVATFPKAPGVTARAKSVTIALKDRLAESVAVPEARVEADGLDAATAFGAWLGDRGTTSGVSAKRFAVDDFAVDREGQARVLPPRRTRQFRGRARPIREVRDEFRVTVPKAYGKGVKVPSTVRSSTFRDARSRGNVSPFDPTREDGPRILVLTKANGDTTFELDVIKAKVKSLGLPAALGLPDDLTLESKVRGKTTAGKLAADASVGLLKTKLVSALVPMDVVLDVSVSGPIGGELATRGTMMLGPVRTSVSGTTTIGAGGLVADLGVRAGPVPCATLGADPHPALVEVDDFLKGLPVVGAFLRQGKLTLTGALHVDAFHPAKTALAVDSASLCGLALFGKP
ncbi:MAG: protein kinase [Polyangiaceae bacterium]